MGLADGEDRRRSEKRLKNKMLNRWFKKIISIKVRKSQKQVFLQVHCPPKNKKKWRISALDSKMG
jgi:ribosomal protein L18